MIGMYLNIFAVAMFHDVQMGMQSHGVNWCGCIGVIRVGECDGTRERGVVVDGAFR